MDAHNVLDEEVEDAEVGQEGEESGHDSHGVIAQIVPHDEGGSCFRGSQFKTEEGLDQSCEKEQFFHFLCEELLMDSGKRVDILRSESRF